MAKSKKSSPQAGAKRSAASRTQKDIPTRVIGLKLGRGTTVKASVFKAKCLDLMDEVQQRQISVVVTKRGTPVAKLGPVDDTPMSPLGFLSGTVVNDRGLIDAEHDAWIASPSDPLD